jgi:hypothetical protein
MSRIDPTPDEPAIETVLAQDQLPALSGAMPLPPPLAKLAPPGWISPRRGIIFAPLLMLALSVGGFYFAPTVERAIRTISTDDAYVNSHVTFVAPRIQGEVARVLVEDYDPERDTLFAGLSVTPYVYFRETPRGPWAGKRLQGLLRPASVASN